MRETQPLPRGERIPLLSAPKTTNRYYDLASNRPLGNVGNDLQCGQNTEERLNMESADTLHERFSIKDVPRDSANNAQDKPNERKPLWTTVLTWIKLAILCGIIIFAMVCVCFYPPDESAVSWTAVNVSSDTVAEVAVKGKLNPLNPILHVKIKGPFMPANYGNISKIYVRFFVARLKNGTYEKMQSSWKVPLAPLKYADDVGISEFKHRFHFSKEEVTKKEKYALLISTNTWSDINFDMVTTTHSKMSQKGIIISGAILIALYILIIFEVVHRTLAAMIGATVALTFLSLMHAELSLEKVMRWMDVETLSLLFGMMVMVAILSETGFFDYVAVLAFRMARGHLWPLITTLCLLTALISAFMDNVTTVLLMSPVIIRLCEVMNVDPKRVLIAAVIFSNIGGAATPVGDPPNVLIIANEKIRKEGVDFGRFILHVFPGIILCTFGAYFYLKRIYRKGTALEGQEPADITELKHDLERWMKGARTLSGFWRDAAVFRAVLKDKIMAIEKQIAKRESLLRRPEDDYLERANELSERYQIRNKPLLVKSAVVMTTVILLFFLQSVPSLRISLGWVAVLGAILLLVLVNSHELESIFERVEWTTLIFFAALFVVMEALSELDFLLYIGRMTENFITLVSKEHRLLVAILLILWVSALASSLIDNIPFTTAMIKIVTNMADNDDLSLPITPLVYALAFGACLGGNGTLIGASANVVCAGVAEQQGYRITFWDFFKIGFPVMLLTTLIATAYLIVCHVLLGWNT